MSVHPFGARITVVDPPASATMGSGLIVIEDDPLPEVGRGIVVEVGSGVSSADLNDGAVAPGDLVYYARSCAVKIGDLYLVNADCILGWEDR